MTQPRILMCPPDFYGIEYEINPWMDRRVGSDPAKSRAQWTALRDTLADLGATIELLKPVEGLPDLVFTANAGLVFNRTFVSSRFRYGVRQGETPVFDAWFAAEGFDVVTLPPDLYFEGAGDALFCGESLFAGYRFRSDARGHLWIGDRLGIEVLPMELVDLDSTTSTPASARWRPVRRSIILARLTITAAQCSPIGSRSSSPSRPTNRSPSVATPWW